jgi:hypothetical protein
MEVTAAEEERCITEIKINRKRGTSQFILIVKNRWDDENKKCDGQYM